MPEHAKNPCCREAANLRVIEDRKDVVRVLQCQICGARHFTAFMDPLVVKARPS